MDQELKRAAAIDAEKRRVVRVFYRFTAEQRARHAASHRLGHRQRTAIGEYRWQHPDAPGRTFTSAVQAARYVVDQPHISDWGA